MVTQCASSCLCRDGSTDSDMYAIVSWLVDVLVCRCSVSHYMILLFILAQTEGCLNLVLAG